MGKKLNKKDAGSFTPEMDQKERESRFIKDAFIIGGGILIILGYILMTVQQYMANHARESFSDAFSNGMSMIFQNPLYFLDFTLHITDDNSNPYNIGLTIVGLFLVALFLFVFYNRELFKTTSNKYTRKGSSGWAKLPYLLAKYADYDGKSYRTAYSNVICSQNFQMSVHHGKHFHALHTLLIGTTGSGKSRYVLKPNLLQMNTSYVVTDPKGAILKECGETLRRNGYNVKVFDIYNMGQCDTYNPMKYCEKESDIKKIVQAFMKNTDTSGGGGNKDPFWDDSMSAFLCACIGLLTTKPEGSAIPYGQIPEITGKTDPVTGDLLTFSPVFANLCELTRMANKKWEPSSGIKLYDGVKLGDGKNNTANASELAAIFENLRAWEANRQGLDPDEMVKPYCLREWENFRIAPEKTSTTILMTTAVRLDPFNIEQVKNLTASDTLDLDTFGFHRDALFVIIPAGDKTYNFLCAFLYTQLFDRLYFNGDNNNVGTKNLYLPNGELVRHFVRKEIEAGVVEPYMESLKHAKAVKQKGGGILHGKTKDKKGKEVNVTFDDGWYDIVTMNGEEEVLITRRQDKASADKFLNDLKHAELKTARGNASPTHVRFLLDEFANIGEIPDFKERLATMRSYEISCMVIVQSITQLKGMYEKDYETVDANCPQKIFLGGDENSTNEYISKKLGNQTIVSKSDTIGEKQFSQGIQVDQKTLMSPDELGRMEYEKELVIIYGERPLLDKKYDYPKHKNYKFTNDYCCDIGCHNGSVFDRNHYEALKNVPLMIRVESASAVPSVEEFSEDAFKKIFCAATLDGAMANAREAARHTWESTSEAMAF